MRSRIALPLLILALASASSCSKNDGGTATLRFSNTVAGFALIPGLQQTEIQPLAMMATAPTVFKMKLIAAYVTEDINPTTQNNVGQTAMIYLNPDCADDIMHCDLSAGTAEDGAAMSHIVTSYFNFGDTSANVNAALNAQGRSIDAGTYRYARLEFCKYNSGNAKNITWNDGTLGADRELQRNSCTVNSSAFTTPITVSAGSSITITLTYDYSSAITTGSSATGDDCTNPGNMANVCFTLPTFVPSAS